MAAPVFERLVSSGGGVFPPVFGDGNGGDVTVSVNTDLAADAYYRNLVVDSGAVLRTNNFKLFVQEQLTLNNGVIACDGPSGFDGGAGAAGGVAVIAGTLRGGTNGGDGGSGDNGYVADPGVLVTDSLGNAGGQGGPPGAAAGTFAAPDAAHGGLGVARSLLNAIQGKLARNNGSEEQFGGGSGGGGGDGDAGGPEIGGGGGAGAGVVLVCAQKIAVASGGGSIRANGGNGGAQQFAGGAAGGGGGGGGVVMVVAHKIEDPGALLAVQALGGAGTGAPNPGQAGSTGNTYTLLV